MKASEYSLWSDTKISFGKDALCDDCKITLIHKTKRGSTDTCQAMNVHGPCEAVTMDIVPNLETEGLTPATHSKYYLLMCDVFSKVTVLLGMNDKSSAALIKTLNTWAVTYQFTESTIHTGPLKGVRTDHDPSFMSEEFTQGCIDLQINLSHAAPRHQKMNGLAERA